MKANELMVGDWLKHANGKYYMVTRIDILGDYNSIHYACGFPHLWEYNNKFEPIPLTQEILEKNGFEKALQVSDREPFDTDEEGNKHYSYNKTFWGWWQPDNIFCIPANGLGWLNIKYVHQLRHALRLCGINETIEL